MHKTARRGPERDEQTAPSCECVPSGITNPKILTAAATRGVPAAVLTGFKKVGPDQIRSGVVIAAIALAEIVIRELFVVAKATL
jgi:hypothetical protein